MLRYINTLACINLPTDILPQTVGSNVVFAGVIVSATIITFGMYKYFSINHHNIFNDTSKMIYLYQNISFRMSKVINLLLASILLYCCLYLFICTFFYFFSFLFHVFLQIYFCFLIIFHIFLLDTGGSFYGVALAKEAVTFAGSGNLFFILFCIIYVFFYFAQ